MTHGDFLFWVFAIITIVSGACAVMAPTLRTTALSLWICGLGVGSLFLGMGAEYIAVAQWILSTLVSVSFVFYSVLFGEVKKKEKPVKVASGIACGLLFIGVINFGFQDLPIQSSGVTPLKLGEFGISLISDHFLSIKVLALTLMMAIVGAGVISRPEKGS